jgi:hypothetical protein
MILLYSGHYLAGIGVYNCLFHSTAITHSFNLFIDIIGVIISPISPDSFSLAVTPVEIYMNPEYNIDPFLLCAIIPIKSYSNAEADKGKILSENTNKSGIYIWKNLVNKKQYIGSSDNLRRRLNNYFNPNHLLINDNMFICRALLKHGYSNFSLTILEYCEPEQCLEREDFYLSCFPHEYNILPKAGSSLGSKHSVSRPPQVCGGAGPRKVNKKISDTMVGNTNSTKST